MINFGELKKAFLYSLKQSYNKISNFNGKLEKVSAFTNNYVIAYFSNGNIYIYYKDFKIKKLYEHCDDLEIQKDTFTIKEKNSDI